MRVPSLITSSRVLTCRHECYWFPSLLAAILMWLGLSPERGSVNSLSCLGLKDWAKISGRCGLAVPHQSSFAILICLNLYFRFRKSHYTG
jgi:hypothetical protein